MGTEWKGIENGSGLLEDILMQLMSKRKWEGNIRAYEEVRASIRQRANGR